MLKRTCYYLGIMLFCTACGASALAVNNSTVSQSPPASDFAKIISAFQVKSANTPKDRRRRYISQNDMIAILDYHNKVRGRVFPPASNMEYMIWDENLAKYAEYWASACLWEHGPKYLLRFLGQNLSVRTGREQYRTLWKDLMWPWKHDSNMLTVTFNDLHASSYRSILQLVKPWYDEVKDYVFPYPRDCNPRCPLKCYGAMCTHYTQMVWATSNRVGCAVHTCHNMNVWGAVWKKATYLVCNYSPKGNWIGEAPYKVGVPCSTCPPSYGGSCNNNMCFPAVNSNYLHWFK